MTPRACRCRLRQGQEDRVEPPAGPDFLQALPHALARTVRRTPCRDVGGGPTASCRRFRTILDDASHEDAGVLDVGFRPRETFQIWTVVARNRGQTIARADSYSPGVMKSTGPE